MEYKVYGSIDLSLEHTGVMMGIQVPLMIIDRRVVSVMSGVFTNRRVTHLKAR